MIIASYVARYVFRLFVRRIVARVIDGDDRPLTGRAKGNQKVSGRARPLSHAPKIFTKSVLWTDSRPAHQRLTENPHTVSTHVGVKIAAAVFPILAAEYAPTVRLNGQFITGTIDKVANIYSGVEYALGHPLPHNDPRNDSTKMG